MTEAYYRSFLTQPYSNANYLSGQGKHSRIQHGGKLNRFGAPLSGNANLRYLFGSPTGGTDGILVRNNDLYKLGGRKRRHYHHGRGTLMDNFINPRTTFHTYPNIGSTIY
jgi:hypothetical protein